MYTTPRKTFFTRNRAARSSTVTKARQAITFLPKQGTRNKPVMRKLRKAKRAPTKVNRNKSAIVTLARQVRTLQNQTMGHFQRNIQYVDLSGGTLPTHDSPCAFLVNDLYHGSHCMKGVITSGTPSFAENAVFQNINSPADIASQYSWVNREQDVVSTLVYKPIYSRMNFTFKLTFPGLTPAPGYVRITIFKVKPFLASNKIDVALPQTLGAYRYLANELPNRGYFSPDYHRILLDKWIKFSPTIQTDSNADRCVMHRTVSIPWKFGQREVMRPDFTGDTGERFWTNIPEAQQTWCLISVGQNLNGMLTNMSIGRINSWRDQHGTT